jgi:hypothetical protein
LSATPMAANMTSRASSPPPSSPREGIYQALPLQFREAAHASVERHQRRRRVPVHRLLHFISSTPAAVIPR